MDASKETIVAIIGGRHRLGRVERRVVVWVPLQGRGRVESMGWRSRSHDGAGAINKLAAGQAQMQAGEPKR